MKKMKLLLLIVLSTVYSVTILGQTGIAPSGINYEKRINILKAPKCNASEVYLKKKVKAQLATFYKDYPFILILSLNLQLISKNYISLVFAFK